MVVKRPSKPRKVKDFLPCPYCFGFYVKEEMWRHAKKCLHATPNQDQRSLQKRSKLLLMAAVSKDTPISELEQSLHDDEVKRTILGDKIIRCLGSILLQKYGPQKKNDICQRMRQLARLKQLCAKGHSYMDLLCGSQYDNIKKATDTLCGAFVGDDGRNSYISPSLALRLGHLLKKIAEVKIGICLRNDDTDGVRQAETFLRLLNSEWTDSVSTNAQNTLKRRKDNDPVELPLTEDLLKVRNYMNKSIPDLAMQLKEAKTYSAWRKLAQMTLARLVVFNKRRPSEVAKLLF